MSRRRMIINRLRMLDYNLRHGHVVCGVLNSYAFFLPLLLPCLMAADVCPMR